MSNLDISKVCGIILRKLYKILAPTSHKPRVSARQNRKHLFEVAIVLNGIVERILNSIVHDNNRSKRKDYRLALRNILNHLEVDRLKHVLKKLCVAAETEKLFWKLFERPKIFFPNERIPCQRGFYNSKMTYVICRGPF